MDMPPLPITHPANPEAEEARPYLFATVLKEEPPTAGPVSGNEKESAPGMKGMHMDMDGNQNGPQHSTHGR